MPFLLSSATPSLDSLLTVKELRLVESVAVRTHGELQMPTIAWTFGFIDLAQLDLFLKGYPDADTSLS
jgi:hypothetical protein